MDDIWHRLGRIFRLSNLGTLIFFLLNFGLLLVVFCPYGLTVGTVVPVLVCYCATVLLSLSPLGEWLLAALAGARPLNRVELKIRLIPLLEIVQERAVERAPSLIGKLRLMIIHDPAPNAFAIGRRTVCVTDGLLQLSDQEIMAVLAHELGHLAYHHTTLQLLIGGSNLLISGFLLIVKVSCWIVTAIAGLFAIGSRDGWMGLLVAFFGAMSGVTIWLWTKFCLLFLRWSMRQNEYVADEFAFRLGFGDALAGVLDRHMCSAPESGLLKALYATHPHSDDRVARLQNLGCAYRRF